MKEMLRLVFVLTAICVAAGLLLAWVNELTAEPIAEAQRAERIKAIRAVLPAYDNEPDTDTYTAEEDGRPWMFYIGRTQGRFTGAAFETSSDKGYSGTITVMAGVNADGRVHAIRILSHKETPGLGAKIHEPEFTRQFAGRDLRSTGWAVRKDGGEIDQITAATISSRAVVQAVHRGLQVYTKFEKEIRAVRSVDPKQTLEP